MGKLQAVPLLLALLAWSSLAGAQMSQAGASLSHDFTVEQANQLVGYWKLNPQGSLRLSGAELDSAVAQAAQAGGPVDFQTILGTTLAQQPTLDMGLLIPAMNTTYGLFAGYLVVHSMDPSPANASYPQVQRVLGKASVISMGQTTAIQWKGTVSNSSDNIEAILHVDDKGTPFMGLVRMGGLAIVNGGVVDNQVVQEVEFTKDPTADMQQLVGQIAGQLPLTAPLP